MYVQRNTSRGKNGKVYRSVLLCNKYREDGKVKTKVLANFSHLPDGVILSIENGLKHKAETLVYEKDIAVEQSIDFGMFFLLHHLMDKLRITEVLEKVMPGQAPLLKAIIIGKIITRGSKLGIFNWLKRNELISSKLGVDIKNKKVDDLYFVLGYSSLMQNKLERKWHLYHKPKAKEVYLYDITSTYFEGTQNELAAFGYNRDKKKGKMQINIGLITDSGGVPLKIEVFEGNVNDYKTVNAQINSIKKEFNVENVIFVGDRGMKIRYNLQEMDEADREGVHYITGLTHLEIESLLKTDIIQLSLFSKDLAEIEHEGTRYILSVNPDLQGKDLDYLKSVHAIVEEEIMGVKASWENRRNKNIENVKRLKAGDKNKDLVTGFSQKKLDAYKLRTEMIFINHKFKGYYEIKEISNDNFIIDFKAEKYQVAKQLAGKYVICTSLKREDMDKTEVRQQYKNLQNVEHAFRDFKSNNIQIRPVYHRNEAQTRGHVLVSMFSYAIIKEMENKIYPFLKQWNKQNNRQLSFSDIMEDLKNIKLIVLNIGRNVQNVKFTVLGPIQEQVLNLFGLKKSVFDKAL
ncbi:MAG TPA: IS1634 family transposase [Bacteroidetes bacterium]|nr:IS1634 family transposase [Bacteroidota bacterium]